MTRKVPIKFRGIVGDNLYFVKKELGIDKGDTIYGGYCNFEGKDAIVYYDDLKDERYIILCDRVDQLVGYDDGGEEIYEGD